jgi:aspartate-semialdehyde dehydrogenase
VPAPVGKSYNIAIVGATGAVGLELLDVLERRAFPVGKLRLLASARSAGKRLQFRGEEVAVEELREGSFNGIDLAFFSAGGETSRKFVPLAVKTGAVVVDNSSVFRMDPTFRSSSPRSTVLTPASTAESSRTRTARQR